MGYTITKKDLLDAADACVSTNQEIQGKLATLRTYVMSLQPRWRGPASLAFTGLMADYDMYARMLGQALADDPTGNIASGLRLTAATYDETETSNVKNLTYTGGNIPRVNL